MNTDIPAQRANAPKGRFWIAIMMMAALLVMSGSTPVLAQGNLVPAISLRDSDHSYDLEASLYIVRDPQGTLTYKKVVEERYKTGQRGDPVRGNVVTLGSKPVPHWLIVPLSNESWTEDWVLSFGGSFSGRLGQMGRLFVYDEESKRTYIDTASTHQNPYKAEGTMMGSGLPIKIERGKKALLVMYIVPEAGMPVLITPRLVTAQSYIQKMNGAMAPSRLILGGFMAMIGFFLATILFRRLWGNFIFILYYGFLLGLFHLQNEVALVKYSFASELSCIMFALVVVTGIVGTQVFLDIKRFYRIQHRAITGFIIGIVIATLVGSLVIGEGTAVKPLMMLLPSFSGIVFMVLLSLAQAQSGKYAAYQFAGAWICMAMGAAITGIAAMGVFHATPLMVAAFWISLVPQAVLLVSSSVTRVMRMDQDELLARREMDDEAESISQLKQSRDASENARLLRVIEHERQVMNELREREIKQNEAMRTARDGADEANRAKSAFLAVISHEIRTPMSGIMGMVRLLLETKLSKEQKDYAQTIQDSGDAMLSLLNDILDFEKIESGKMELEHIDFDIHRLIQGVVTLMSGHAEAKSIVLKHDIDPAVPRYIVGDPVRLRQVILNLVGNSIKFTERGGVTVHIKRDQTGEQRAGIVKIRIAVQDTGIGISRDAQKNLFNPFAQADTSVSRRFGGTGLGLAISQRLIEAMGGRIAIDSTEGRGSTFYFNIVVEEGSAAGAESMGDRRGAAFSAKPDRVMRILIVEDNEISQKLMREFVQRMGHNMVIVGSGEDAISKAEREDFDMALMDVELPGISGMGATKAIRALRDKKRAALPVIAMTGNVRDEDIHSCYAANMNGHIAKPIDPQKLKEAIQKVIDGKLDNPVQVEENGPNYPHMQETEIRLSMDSLAAASAMDLEGESHTTGPQVTAPIRELLMEATTMALEDEDEGGEGDSFSVAIRRGASTDATADEATGAGVFDDTMLNGLRQGLSADAVRQLIDELFVKAEEIIGDIGKATAANDIPTLAARAHELKGMAANFGLVEVSKLAEKAERAAKDNSTDAMPEVLAGLDPANGRAKAAMRKWLSS